MENKMKEINRFTGKLNNHLVNTIPVWNGVQHLFRFDNGFGASVIKHDFSYGGKSGKWELAVIKFKDSVHSKNASWSINTTTKITDDVLGFLNDRQVASTLRRIKRIVK